jgi:hypothetical protein
MRSRRATVGKWPWLPPAFHRSPRQLPIGPTRWEPRRGGAVLATYRDEIVLPLATVAAPRFVVLDGSSTEVVTGAWTCGAAAVPTPGAFVGKEESAGPRSWSSHYRASTWRTGRWELHIWSAPLLG